MKTMRVRAKALFDELSYLPVMSMSGRIAAINLLEKILIEVHVDAQNNEVDSTTLSDKVQNGTQVWINDEEPRIENLSVSDFLGDVDVKY